MVSAERVQLANGTAMVFSTRAVDKATANEDAASIIQINDQCAVLMVCDGVGGSRAGDAAARTTIERLSIALEAGGNDVRGAILDGIEQANRAVRQLETGAATTLSLAEIDGERTRSYHIGDSQLLQVGQRGKIKQLTVSHSPVGFAVEAGLIDNTEAMHHEARHLVSNVIGTADMRIEVGSRCKMASRDTLILASDGLFDNLHIDEIVETIRKGRIEAVAQALITATHSRMTTVSPDVPSKPDDLTFIVFRRHG